MECANEWIQPIADKRLWLIPAFASGIKWWNLIGLCRYE
jgi:hypothetical protein